MKGYVEISTSEVKELANKGLEFIYDYREKSIERIVSKDYYMFYKFFKRKFKNIDEKIKWLKSHGGEMFSHTSYYNAGEVQYYNTEQELIGLINTCEQKENDESQPNNILLTLNAIEQLRNIAFKQEDFNYMFLAYH